MLLIILCGSMKLNTPMAISSQHPVASLSAQGHQVLPNIEGGGTSGETSFTLQPCFTYISPPISFTLNWPPSLLSNLLCSLTSLCSHLISHLLCSSPTSFLISNLLCSSLTSFALQSHFAIISMKTVHWGTGRGYCGQMGPESIGLGQMEDHIFWRKKGDYFLSGLLSL